MAIKGTFHRRKRPSAPIFSTLQRFSVLRTSKRCFPTPATIIFPFRSHARHWLWIRLGLKAAVGQTTTRTTDEANLFIHVCIKDLSLLLGERDDASAQPPGINAGPCGPAAKIVSPGVHSGLRRASESRARSDGRRTTGQQEGFITLLISPSGLPNDKSTASA